MNRAYPFVPCHQSRSFVAEAKLHRNAVLAIRAETLAVVIMLCMLFGQDVKRLLVHISLNLVVCLPCVFACMQLRCQTISV